MSDQYSKREPFFWLMQKWRIKWVQKMNCLKDLQLSFVARNLCFLYKKAPFDPDLVLSTGNDNQGIEVFGMPTTRSLGFTLTCEF